MKKNIKESRGFTLAEIMVTMTIFVIMTVLVVSFYISGLKIFREKSAERDLIFNAQNTLRDITDNLQKSVTIVENVIINMTTYTSGNQTIIAEIPAIDENGETIFQDSEVTTFDYIIYDYDPNSETIVKHVYPNVASSRSEIENFVLMKQVDSFTFEYSPENPPVDWLAVENIKTNLSAYKIVSNNTKRISLSNTIKPRNN